MPFLLFGRGSNTNARSLTRAFVIALHFKLAISNDTDSETYDDAQWMYRPQLDASRDAELIGILPDYLIDEITFPRPHAAKFYARVTKSLTERPVDDE